MERKETNDEDKGEERKNYKIESERKKQNEGKTRESTRNWRKLCVTTAASTTCFQIDIWCNPRTSC
jgi:hypothetical protein